MSDRMQVQDGRKPPFLWCSLDSMRHLRAVLPTGRKLIGAKAVYTGIAEIAAERYDFQHQGFEASRAEIAERAGMNERWVGDHLQMLAAVGLLDITVQTTITGSKHSSVYRLVDPALTIAEARERVATLEARRNADRTQRPISESRGDVASSQEPPVLTQRPGPDVTSDVTSGPTRARDTGGEVKDDGRTEGPRAHTREQGEQEALSELAALAADRGLLLDEQAVVDAIRSHPGIAHLTAAKRLRETYGSSGPAGRRRITDLAAIFRAELDQRQPERPRPPARGRRGRRGQQAIPASRASELSVHRTPPAGLEAPSRRLLEHWERIRGEAKGAVSESSWLLWLEPIELAGFLNTLTTELGEEQETVRRTLVLACPPDQAMWIAASFHRLLEACAAAVLGPNVGVELLATDQRSAA